MMVETFGVVQVGLRGLIDGINGIIRDPRM